MRKEKKNKYRTVHYPLSQTCVFPSSSTSPRRRLTYSGVLMFETCSSAEAGGE
jgi:hypothetical protein